MRWFESSRPSIVPTEEFHADRTVPLAPHRGRRALRGDAKANIGQNAEALKDYNSAIKIDPEYQYAYVRRCETRLQLDDTAGALSDCDAGIRLDGSDSLAYEDRGDVHFTRGAYGLALADYDKAVQLGRSSAYLFGGRCDAERLVGKRDLARADLDVALRGYRKSGDTAQADRVASMVKAISAGRQPVP